MSLPAYKSHKIVHAAKILSIGESQEDVTNLVLELPDGKHMGYGVSTVYMRKHKPASEGYLVVYSDGYESWSPADAFEKGYDLLEPTPNA